MLALAWSTGYGGVAGRAYAANRRASAAVPADDVFRPGSVVVASY
jgi:hypothetical protein